MNLQIINAVWGEKYINTFLQLSLPTQFSPGNLKTLSSKPNYIIYTDQLGKAQVLHSPIYKKLKDHTNVIFRLIEIDKKTCPFDILLQCHSDAIKEANKLSAPIVFLAPDCILSINVFSYLEKAVHRKNRLVAICSARMSLEKYKEIIQEKEGSLLTEEVHWTSQDLAKTTINNLHHRGKCLLMGNNKISSHPSQMYWKLDENNLLAKAFHLHPLLIWPEVHNIYPLLSADGKSFLEKICPQKTQWETIKDCSEISLFEISSNKQFTSDSQIPINSFWFRKWVNENTSEAHYHFIKHDIILGDSIAKPDWDQKIIEANQFLTNLLKIKYKETFSNSNLIKKLSFYCKSIKKLSQAIDKLSQAIDKLSLYYNSSLIAKMDRDFFKWHLTLFYYVISGKKKFTWKKFKNHFFYLFKYKNFPIHTLKINSRKKRRILKEKQS